MAEDSKIQWTDHTWNPWRGCTKISDGCKFCYAEAGSGRNHAVLGVWGPHGTRVVASEAMWKEPSKWDRAGKKAGVRKKVFCASLADVFESWDGPMCDSNGGRLRTTTRSISGLWAAKLGDADGDGETPTRPLTMDDVRLRLMCLVMDCESLEWLILTKRPENVLPTLARLEALAARHLDFVMVDWLRLWLGGHPPANVWMGTSVEDQTRADERLVHLVNIPARVRFISAEPLLGPVSLMGWDGELSRNWLGEAGGRGISWLIIGGESGSHARQCEREWMESLVGQCKAAGVAVFVKQAGAAYSDATNGVAGKSLLIPADALGLLSRRLKDPKGGDMEEWPELLRVRQFPEASS